METDLYSFAFRGILAEEALDKAGHKKYTAEEAFFSESLAKELHFDEIDSKYVEQSKTMITVFATITAFENATREFVFSTLAGAYGDDWWAKGVQNGIREKAQSRKDSETKVKWHINRGDMMMSYLEFGDLPKIMCSQGNWPYFEPYFATVYKWNIIKNLIMDCQSYTKYRPNETTGGIFVSWRRKEELPTGA